MTPVQRGAYLRRDIRNMIIAIRMIGSRGLMGEEYSRGYGVALDALETACDLGDQSAHYSREPVSHAFLCDELAAKINGIGTVVQSSNADPLFAAGATDALIAIGRALNIPPAGSRQRTVAVMRPQRGRLGGAR